MYYSCHCIKRNGLQHDCRRTGCGGEPTCLALPDPLCAPSQLARARGLADPAPLAAHLPGAPGAGSGGSSDARKKFIVCELKGILPEVSADKSGKCCKCLALHGVPTESSKSNSGGFPCNCRSSVVASQVPSVKIGESLKCPAYSCASESKDNQLMFVFDDNSLKDILKRFDTKELVENDITPAPGGRHRKVSRPVNKEEPCTRPGCIHWQPPPPCEWDLPCKADCFEASPGIQAGRNPLTGGGGLCTMEGSPRGGAQHRPQDKMKLLTPECCTGCCSSGGGTAATSGGADAAAGLPVLVMKLC